MCSPYPVLLNVILPYPRYIPFSWHGANSVVFGSTTCMTSNTFWSSYTKFSRCPIIFDLLNNTKILDASTTYLWLFPYLTMWFSTIRVSICNILELNICDISIWVLHLWSIRIFMTLRIGIPPKIRPQTVVDRGMISKTQITWVRRDFFGVELYHTNISNKKIIHLVFLIIIIIMIVLDTAS